MWLDKLVDATRERVDAGYYDARPEPEAPGDATGLEANGSLAEALRRADPAIAAEIKPARPEGQAYPVNVGLQASRYADGGACAISVLTDPDHFDGALENLAEARGAGLPLLMKDFLVDPAQVAAAHAWGASAILAIARLPREGYTDYTLAEMCRDAHNQGLEVLAEVVTADELDRALDAGADAVGVNVRDLDTLELDPDRVRALLADREVPVPALQLSDVRGPEQVQAALEAGADGALVGTHLMEAEDPARALEDLVEVTPR